MVDGKTNEELFYSTIKNMDSKTVVDILESLYTNIVSYRCTVIAHLYVLIDQLEKEKHEKDTLKKTIKEYVLSTKYKGTTISNQEFKDYFIKLVNMPKIDFNSYDKHKFNSILYLVHLDINNNTESNVITIIDENGSDTEIETENKKRKDEPIQPLSYSDYKNVTIIRYKNHTEDEITYLFEIFNISEQNLFSFLWDLFKQSKLGDKLKEKSKIRYRQIYRIYIFHLLTEIPLRNILYKIIQKGYSLNIKLLFNVDTGKLNKSLENLFDNFLNCSNSANTNVTFKKITIKHNDNKTLKIKLDEKIFVKFQNKYAIEKTNQYLEKYKNHSTLQKKLYDLLKSLDYKVTYNEISDYIIKYYQ